MKFKRTCRCTSATTTEREAGAELRVWGSGGQAEAARRRNPQPGSANARLVCPQSGRGPQRRSADLEAPAPPYSWRWAGANRAPKTAQV